jgi:thiol-disulfide isomerase/thioredoxin
MRSASALVALALVSPWTAWSEEPYSLLKPGDQPPALQFRTLDGQAPDWADLAGTAVVLDFWATWCGPCIKAIPHLNQLVDEFAGRPVRFISVTYEKEEVVRPVLAKHPCARRSRSTTGAARSGRTRRGASRWWSWSVRTER